jgi:hypothetical protein
MKKKIAKSARQTTKIFLLFAVCFSGIGSLWGEMDCQKSFPIPATATDKSVETDAGLDLFKGIFRVPPISAHAKMKATMTQREVLSKYPNADVVALRQQELSYVCQLLNADPTMKTAQKAAILQNVVEGTAMPKSVTPTRSTSQPHSLQPAPTPAAAPPPTKTIEVAPGGHVVVEPCAAFGIDNNVTCNPPQRRVSPEQFQKMSYNHNDGVGETLVIAAQSGDDESSVLASQLQTIFTRFGFYVPPVVYEDHLPKFPDIDSDVLLVATTGTQNGADFVWATFGRTPLKYHLIQADRDIHTLKPAPSGLDMNPHRPMTLYVYPENHSTALTTH